MLAKRIVPCLDIDKGRVVKGVNFVDIRDAGFVVSFEETYDMDVLISDEDILITLDWPITITKGELIESEDKFSVTFNEPLGKLIKTASDIVDFEAEAGIFFHDKYMFDNDYQVIITKTTLESKFYDLHALGDEYEFRFAVRGMV